ncbi:hypothetical protein BC943DRAFT_319269 [Umbelopsis sp. AD052]|nr:hypothetical protein BC943DRAFT_319269 [Umbelopsis sp. AD052]
MARQYEPRGWLVKLSTGTLRKQWHRRYFVLSGHEIRYYRQENDVYPAGYINLQEYHYAHPESVKKMPFTFSILSKDRSKRPYVLYAENAQDMMIWIESLRTVFKNRDVAIRKNASTTSTGTDEQEYNDSVLDKWLHRLDLDEPKHQLGSRDFEIGDQVSVSSSSQIENSLLHGSHDSRRSTESLASSVQSDSASSILSTSSSGTTDVTTPTSPSSRNSVMKQPNQQPQLQANQQDMSRNRVRTNRYGVKALHTSSVSHPVPMSSFLTQQPTVASHMSSATNIEQNPFFNPRVPPRNRNRPSANDHRSPPSSPRSFIMRPDQILSAGSGKDIAWVLQDDGALGSSQKRASCPPIESIP